MGRNSLQQIEKERQIVGYDPETKLPARHLVTKFLHKVALGESKFSAFREVFPISKDWSNGKLYSHINAILMKKSSMNVLKKYRDNLLEMLDQKKVDLILYLENMIYNDDTININQKLKAVETYGRFINLCDNKNQHVIQQNINIGNTAPDSQTEINNIFGINNEEEDCIETEYDKEDQTYKTV